MDLGIICCLLSFNYSAILRSLKDDLEYHSIGLTFIGDLCLQYYPPQENSTLYFQHFSNDVYTQPKELQWQVE